MAIETWIKRDKNDVYKTEVDVNVIEDFVMLCSCCHVACTGICRFWCCAKNRQLCLVQIDQQTLLELV